MPKWFLRDWTSPQRVAVGILGDLHTSDSDDDTTFTLSLLPDFAALLTNRHGQPNSDARIECEVNVRGDSRAHFQQWLGSFDTEVVTAQGVWVDDDEHASKTELHPVDVIFAPVTRSLLLSGDWIGALAAQRGLRVGESLLAFRFAAASDIRQDDVPPLAEWTRAVQFTVPLPPLPPGTGWAPDVEVRIDLQQNADISTTVLPTGSVQVTVTCLGRDYGGPGVLTGELATCWQQAVPRITISPDHCAFGTVAVGDTGERIVHIGSTGQAALVVSIAGPVPHSPFRWDPVAATTLAPGAGLDVPVDFSPRGVGTAQGTLLIQSNAAPSAQSVPLQGTGKKGSAL